MTKNGSKLRIWNHFGSILILKPQSEIQPKTYQIGLCRIFPRLRKLPMYKVSDDVRFLLSRGWLGPSFEKRALNSYRIPLVWTHLVRNSVELHVVVDQSYKLPCLNDFSHEWTLFNEWRIVTDMTCIVAEDDQHGIACTKYETLKRGLWVKRIWLPGDRFDLLSVASFKMLKFISCRTSIFQTPWKSTVMLQMYWKDSLILYYNLKLCSYTLLTR